MAGTEGLKLFCICLLSIYLLNMGAVAASPRLRRSSFPRGFKFGAGSSAYQVEGAASQGGRGPSVWDTFSRIKGKIADGKNGDVSVDQYHRYVRAGSHQRGSVDRLATPTTDGPSDWPTESPRTFAFQLRMESTRSFVPCTPHYSSPYQEISLE